MLNNRYIKKLTLSKVLNLTSLYAGYWLWVWFKLKLHWGKPAALSIEPTTKCNLHCPECVSGLRAFTRNEGNIDIEMYKRIIEQNAKYLTWLNLYFQGEPFLHPQWHKLIRLASEMNIYTVTSTNAHYLTNRNCRLLVESGLDKLVVSVDGASQQTYAEYRVGGSLQVVLRGIELLVETRNKMHSRTPYIEMQFIVFAHNEHEISEMKELALRLGVDKLVLKTAQLMNPQEKSHLFTRLPGFLRYKTSKEGSVVVKSKLADRCWRMWHSSVITQDGMAVPCCFDKNADYVLGNLNQQSLNHIWHDKPMQEFRKAIQYNRKGIPMCTNCTEGLRMSIGDS